MITIDRDVPIPVPRDSYTRYPIKQMLPGDSIGLSCPLPIELARLRSAVHYYRKRYQWRFTVRRMTPGHVRVWRLA